MRPLVLLTLLLVCFLPGRAQQPASSYYFYDGLLIRTPEFISALDSNDIQSVEVITTDVTSRYKIPEENGLVLITTKPKLNKKLKAFTTAVYQLVKEYPFAEISMKGTLLNTDSERVATLNKVNMKKTKVNFYVPKAALSKYGERGQNGVIDIVDK